MKGKKRGGNGQKSVFEAAVASNGENKTNNKLINCGLRTANNRPNG